jgi:steroid 5-alpha reductase family enzyme
MLTSSWLSSISDARSVNLALPVYSAVRFSIARLIVRDRVWSGSFMRLFGIVLGFVRTLGRSRRAWLGLFRLILLLILSTRLPYNLMRKKADEEPRKKFREEEE